MDWDDIGLLVEFISLIGHFFFLIIITVLFLRME